MPLSRRRLLLYTACLAAVRVTGSFALQAQMLSRPGWRGTNITPEAWWKHAAFVRLDAETTFADAATELPWMSDVSADSMVLPDLLPTAEIAAGTPPLPFAPRFGTEDELDALMREASARHMHVLLQAPVHRLVANQGEVRFWMNRGIAGFDVGTVGAADMDGLRQLRSALDKFPGQRILMARVTANGSGTADAPAASAHTKHGGAAGSASSSGGHDPVTLHIVSAADVESGKLGRSATTSIAPLLVEIAADVATPAAAKEAVDPAVLLPGSLPGLRSLLPLLLASGTPILDSSLIRTPEQRAAIQQVLALRNSHVALRNGTSTPLATQTQGLRAWLISGRERAGKSSLLLAVNEGTVVATLHMSDAIKHAGIRGTYLRPILRSDGAMGSVNLENGQLPPGAAILAEIHGD